MLFKKGLHRYRRARYFRRIMKNSDAMRLALLEDSPRKIEVFLTTIGKRISLRGNTTDIACFQKVFLGNEYRLPYELSPRLIIDAGANVGMATLYFAARYPNATVVAIEPELGNFRMLQQNCAGLENAVLVQAALWPDNGKLKLNSSNESWAFSVSEIDSSAASIEVSAVTIDDLLRRFNATKIDLLKLDIEGAELELFSRAAANWIDRVEHIAIELHDRLRPGCAQAFYSSLASREFLQEVKGENIFVRIMGASAQPAL
jgi:FkbM family methyltransferase